MRLHHVNVVVGLGQTDVAIGFYADVLGLTRIDKPLEGVSASGAWFAVDGFSQLHVSERAGRVHEDAHFAVVVDDFDGMLARLTRIGAAWRDAPDLFGGRRGFTRDPAGNRIEVLEAAGQLA